MPKVLPLLETIFQNKGGNPQLWIVTKEDLKSQPDEIRIFSSYIKNKISSYDKNDSL